MLHQKRLLSSIDQVFELVFRYHNDGGAIKNRCHTCPNGTFPPTIASLKQSYSFRDEDVVHLQINIDKWYHAWRNIAGLEGIINYIHLLVSGHITYCLIKYSNLYRYSN